VSPYIDTSALAKWYLNEPRSQDFESYIRGQRGALISRLTVIELRCLLARRRRAGELSEALERRVFATFENDVGRGFLDLRPLHDDQAIVALELLAVLRRHALRTLDALHLAVARDAAATVIASADRVMIGAAESLGFEVVRFD
jgi:predicted nucleic acid-binding protein